jgi:hypothetical protein
MSLMERAFEFNHLHYKHCRNQLRHFLLMNLNVRSRSPTNIYTNLIYSNKSCCNSCQAGHYHGEGYEIGTINETWNDGHLQGWRALNI